MKLNNKIDFVYFELKMHLIKLTRQGKIVKNQKLCNSLNPDPTISVAATLQVKLQSYFSDQP